MKIKVNGIQINYRIDGPDGAPWVTMSSQVGGPPENRAWR